MRSLLGAMALLSFVGAMPRVVAAQAAPAGVSREEEALCRGDAIRLCFFSLGSSDGLRACLRGKKPRLSDGCRQLIESRGN
jgi:hypothetical protein